MPARGRSAAAAQSVGADAVLAWLESKGTKKDRDGMLRFGIPNDHAFGVPMGTLKAYSKTLGSSHALAGELWTTGWYEARTLAAFVDEPSKVTARQMDVWAHDFDTWAICDTVCFHLFDKTPFAWDKTSEWAAAPEEFVRRAAYALIWSLTVHDKKAPNARFTGALELIEGSEPDERPLVKKAVDMALRATGKRNATLNRAAIAVAKKLAASKDKHRAWIGKTALRELTSAKVQARFER